MSENPWYPFYVGDYLQKTAHLSLAEHGAYRLLIDHYMATRHFLPKNHTILYQICRVFRLKDRRIIDDILMQFFVKKDEGYFHDKCEEIIAKQLNISKSQSARATLGHVTRQKSGKKIPPLKTCPGDAPDMPTRARLPQPQSKEEKKESSSYTTASADKNISVHTDDDAGFEKSESGGEKLISAHAEWTKEAQKIRDYITKRLPNLKKQNASCVPKWLNLGLTYGEIIETIEETINLKNADIGSFAYLNRCIESVIQVKIERDEQTKRMREKYAKPE